MTEGLLLLVRFHLAVHRWFAPPDLAKLLCQGALGMDHLLADRERFLEDLEREWQELNPHSFPGEPLLEPVHPARPIFRVNLRPARRIGIDLVALGTVLADQPLRAGTWDELGELWTGTVRLARDGCLPLGVGELVAQGREMMRTRRPPHHSPRYRVLNLPAYCLIRNPDLSPPRPGRGGKTSGGQAGPRQPGPGHASGHPVHSTWIVV